MATSTAALQPYTKGTRAWFPDKDEGFVSATLESSQITDDKVTLNFIDDNGAALSFTSSITDLEKENFTALPPLRNPPMLESTEDLTNLSYLNEPAVLNSIRTRYTNRAQIYTYSGIVLVAVNPFSAVPLYGNELVQAYAGKRKGELEPHLFAIAEEAYRCMIRDNKNQTIIVSGESGAGKTVSAKYIMRYFATVDDPDKPGKRKTKDKEGMSEVERQILATNPIMEAFGNAKTTRNDNSSRFGKYIEILFDNTQTIIGARIRTYLLERSRLVYQPETERNYHIFYQLLAGCPSSDLKSIGLDDASNFFYMNQGGAAARVIPGLDDAEELKATEKALDTVGITSSTRWKIFQLLGALLHIGNVEIKQTRSDAYISEDDPHVKYVVDLLGIDASEYKKWTVKKQITTRSEKIVTALTSAQAIVVRDSVAKYIYACLFDWLVSIVNDSLAKDRGEVASFIGVLDIYGFEHFKKNSFEQFCINYANEQLQQEFNAHVFKLEQEEYKAEQINWKYIDFSDNQPTIDLIEGKLGIIALLDEESRLPSGSDQTLIQKLHTELGKPQHAKIFKKPRFGQSAFTIAHYAHDVTYEIDGFLEKNRDTVPDEHLAMLNATTNPFLKEVLDRAAASHQTPSVGTPKDPGTPNEVAKPGRKGPGASARKPTLGSIFKASLIQLKETIDSTNAHYIRCIKPNEAKAAWEFDPPLVLSQLKACGVLETIRISCAGYPTRWTFEEFAERYYMLTPSANWGPDLRNLCTLILDASIKDEDKYQIGLTKIFFRAGMLAYMETVRTDRLNYLVTLMQKRALAHYHQTRYQRLRRTTVGIQSMWRRILARREADRRRKEGAALDIQKAVRGFLQRKQYLRTRQAVITLQAALRGRKVRLLYLEQKKEMAAVKLQSFWRGRSVRNQYIKDRSDIAKVQACVRRHQARTQLKTLRVAARSASHFKEVSYKLENKVVELTQALQRRTAENKEQQAKIKALEVSIQSWVVKFEDAEKKSREELDLQKKSSVPLPEFESLSTQKREVDEKLEESMKKITDQDAQIEKLMAEFATQTDELEARQKQLSGASTNGDEGQTVGSLRAELATLREQLRGVSGAKQSMSAHQRGDPAFSTTLGKSHENGTPLVGAAALQATPGKRRNRRGSVPQIYPSDSTMSTLPPYDEFQPKSYSMAGSGYPNDTLKRLAAEEDLDPEAIADEIIRLLEEEKPLDEDVLGSLITSLRIPPPSSTTPPVPKEVLFPAHLISLITNEMWKYGMLKESERFLANVMQTIQQHVMSFTGEDSIIPGIFWLSNVHEILSFVCIAESDILQGIGPGAEGMGRDFDWDEYEHLVTIVKHDLDSLEYNIYHTWMSEAKKLLGKMAVPALVEYQALPGFLSNEGAPKLFNRLLHGNTTPAFNTDDILSLLNKIHKALKSYYVGATVIQQVVTELLKLIGVQSFNELLMRRNFCSWKRAMQIQYNITRIEEWCQSKDMPEGTLQLEHLMQATKLLQLKKASTHDIEIICDVCWMLTPTQIQKLISNYAVADYETPISPEVLKAVASRVMANDRNDHLLLPPEGEDVGPYDTPLPRHIEDLYTYVPAWLSVPHLRKVTAYLDA